MKLLLFPGLFQTNRIWDKIVQQLPDQEIIYINPYEPMPQLDADAEYFALTISYGYRVYLQLRKEYKFIGGIHVSPAMRLNDSRWYVFLVNILLPVTPNILAYNPLIFGLSRKVTGDQLFIKPWEVFKYMRHPKNKKIIQELAEPITTIIPEDFYIANERDKLIEPVNGDVSYDAGHNAIYYHDVEISAVVLRVQYISSIMAEFEKLTLVKCSSTLDLEHILKDLLNYALNKQDRMQYIKPSDAIQVMDEVSQLSFYLFDNTILDLYETLVDILAGNYGVS